MGLDIYFVKAEKNGYNEKKMIVDELEEQSKSIYSKIANAETQEAKKQLEEQYKAIRGRASRIIDYEDVAYFRKVNFLMAFFGYTGNCEYIEISKQQVSSLVSSCERVLSGECKAKDILPTQSGFFFGSTDYNDYYYDDIRSVLSKFRSVLNSFDWESQILFMYCWW